MISEKMSKLLERSAAMSSMYTESARLKEKYGAENVYDFGMGNPNLPAPDSIRETSIRVLQETDPWYLHHYIPNNGFPEAREKIAASLNRRFGEHFDANNIMMCTGAAGGLNCLLKVLMDPGQEILTFAPYFGEYDRYADNVGCTLTTVPPNIPTFQPDPAALEKCVTEKTRAVLIDNPNNPTGYLYTRREMMQIRDLVKRYDLFLFSDEVYREFIYTGSPYISACHLEGIEQNVVLIDSVSKRYSECGIRIGALITKNRALHDAVMKFCQARLSPPLVGQIVAEASIDAPREYHTEVYDEYIARRKCLIDGLNRLPGVYSPIPMGAFYTVARLPIDDSDRFCAWCLGEFDYEGETVMLAPASGFYSDPTCGRNEVRIAYVLCQQDLQRAIRVLGEALKRYRREVMGEE